MEHPTGNLNNTAGGTIGGTLLVIVSNIPLHDIGKTTILAFFGALTSFTVSLCLQYLYNKRNK